MKLLTGPRVGAAGRSNWKTGEGVLAPYALPYPSPVQPAFSD